MVSRRQWLQGIAALSVSGTVMPKFASAAPAKGQIPLGVAWYPEQWPEARWAEDVTLMKAAGINLVRIAEFAWSSIEPEEGRYDFEWLDRAIKLAGGAGFKIVICTPTAAPPAWMTKRYPDIVLTEQTGVQATHGGRRHYSNTSTRYLDFARTIAGRLAARYGQNPAIVGWQIDNEYGRFDFGPVTEALFRQWLGRRFKTLAAFNEALSGAYWSQGYSDWDQVIIPRLMTNKHNPVLIMNWRIFVNETWRDYQQVQIDALRPHLLKSQFITTNYTGFWDNIDQFVTAQPLDMVAWDWYFEGEHLDPAEGSLLHNMARGLKQKNVWVMEVSAGHINWNKYNYATAPGEARAMAWQALAHGADAYCFWTWRNPSGGQEQLHGAILGNDGQPSPFYEEVSAIGRDFAAAGTIFAETTPIAKIALLHDYNSRWGINSHRHHEDFDPWKQMVEWHRATGDKVDALDVVSPSAKLTPYKLVLAPSLHVMKPGWAEALKAYVEVGGHLVLGPRSGVKNEQNGLIMDRAPGPVLKDVLGAGVAQVYGLPKAVPVTGSVGSGQATIWGELIEPVASDVETWLTFGDGQGWLKGRPAVISRKAGKGRITYVGAWLDEALMSAIVARCFEMSGIATTEALPRGVERRRRSGKSGVIDVVINWNLAPTEVTVPKDVVDRLNPKRPAGPTALLQPYEVMVLTKKRP